MTNLTRRWVRAKPGSVLILVIALLVLLALIGTAYLSSTQTERYSSVQNSINTEADLLITGVQNAVTSQIANSLYGSGASGTQYRPPTQEMPTYPGGAATPAPVPSGYANYDSTSVDSTLAATAQPPDLFLADRIPTAPPSTTVPTWNTISWPLFTDGSGNYTFDSPFGASTSTYSALNKGKIVAVPTSETINGQTYPAFYYYVPGGSIMTSTGPVGATFLNPGGPSATRLPNLAASAAGDGIADAGLVRLPIGQIEGVTYYVATRVIDDNSAVNVSSAWSTTSDPAVSNVAEPVLPPVTPSAQTQNYGFFRSNIGLREMLSVPSEMNALNAYRFDGVLPSSTPVTPTLNSQPVGDDAIPPSAAPPSIPTPRTGFSWYSAGDAIDQQLTRRAGNPGYNTTSQKFIWLGQTASSPLAYKFSLLNPAGQSVIEQILSAETYNYTNARSTPYSPAQVYGAAVGAPGFWFGDLFNFAPSFYSGATTAMPLRTVLVGTNPVSNAIPSRLGSNSVNAPGSAWSPSATYEFGDWVTNNGFSYVSLLHNAIHVAPGTSPVAPPEYWAQVPWTTQPVKTSINTATFNQLWLGFCHVMTDSVAAVSATNSVPLWQPPMLPTAQAALYPETQMQMFRSVIRDNRSYPIANTSNTGSPTGSGAVRVQLTPMQMMQLRAALAAINLQSMRNAPFDMATRQVRSHHITLADNSGNPAYSVEVFSTDIQPYIGQVYARIADAGGAATTNFIAIQLLNPYPVAITINNSWGFATINRTKTAATPALTLTSLLTSQAALPTIIIPAATAAGPGSAMIWDGVAPTKFTTPVPLPALKVPGLVTLLEQARTTGQELVILKPRRLDNTLSNQVAAWDSYIEGAAAGAPNLYDLVPVDQLDLTGINSLALPAYLVYKRAANPALVPNNPSYAWNFTWPGFYTPYNTSNTVGPKTAPPNAPAAQPVATYPFSQPILSLFQEPNQGQLDFTALPYGAADTSGTLVPPQPTYNTIPLQLNNVGFPGPNPVGSLVNQFPFGGFPRNVDILQVPFIGAYRICGYGTPPSTGFYEMNSVTMDSSLANDSTLQPNSANGAYAALYPNQKVLPTSTGYTTVTPVANIPADSVSDPFVEQIGRFCPVGDSNGAAANYQLDFGTDSTQWHYHWAKKIFDYFTVQAPHDDYLPNVDPAAADNTASPAIPVKFPGATGAANSSVVPVNNSQIAAPSAAGYYANATVAGKSEDTVGVEGLININTAPWPVLAKLPFVALGTDKISFNDQSGLLSPAIPTAPTAPTAVPNGIDDNIDIAKAIVYYRTLHGPFKSIADLYNVPAFRLENEFLLANDPTNANGLGDFSGGPTSTSALPTPDGIRFDFEERFLLLNNISNLITTRSDTFTCYVLLQGWRNVGTGNPTLVVQRRAAFLVDRNGVTPSNNQPSVTKIPSE